MCSSVFHNITEIQSQKMEIQMKLENVSRNKKLSSSLLG